MSLLITEDGSHSLKDERTGETYHSIHGAVQESQHIFIERGLNCSLLKELNVFEVGFGTGLNAFLTWIEAEKSDISIRYTSVELYPVEQALWEKLNFESVSGGEKTIINKNTEVGCETLVTHDGPMISNQFHRQEVDSNNQSTNESNNQPQISFHQLHTCSWGSFHTLSPHFSFRKLQVDFIHYTPDMHYDLIYFDAFSPEKQPELWLPERFATLAQHCNPGAILTTYCAKGIVKQALRDAGFTVERLQGPPGKRHMLRGRL